MGNKKRLIKKGLIEYFPEKIDTFVDVFSGSSIVSMNTNAEYYIVNDKDKHLYDLYLMFKEKSADDIIEHINAKIEEYHLPKIRLKRNKCRNADIIRDYKKAYLSFRKYANESKDIMDFYTLMFFSFSQIMRFNKQGLYNSPFGTDCFSELNKQYIKNGCDFFQSDNCTINNMEYEECIDRFKNEKNVFFYFTRPI